MSLSDPKFENLVFEGGGVKGAAYAGAVQVLDNHNLLGHVKGVAGTSAGSITASLLAVGAGSKGLTESILDSNFHQFIYDPGWLFMDVYRLFRNFGIHSGDGFVKILKGYYEKYCGDPDITFAQLNQRVIDEPSKYKELKVIASNITTQQQDIFDHQRTPDVPIWKAVRCSMSIPLIFIPVKMGDCYYVDGGLGWNFPIDVFDKLDKEGEPIHDSNTLGFFLEPQNQVGFKPGREKINSVKSAVGAMMNFMYNAANSKNMHHQDRKRTVFIDDLGVSGINFDISKEKIDALIKSGKDATEEYLDNNQLINIQMTTSKIKK